MKKRRAQAQRALLELNALTVTVHGRIMLEQVINDQDNGLPPEIRRMYYVLAKNAPIAEWSQWN